MTAYPDSTPTMNALMDLAERPIPRHPGWRPNGIELAMGEPFIFCRCDCCGDDAEIAHLAILPYDGPSEWFFYRFCAQCVAADPDPDYLACDDPDSPQYVEDDPTRFDRLY
jgi:hypothetical protein